MPIKFKPSQKVLLDRKSKKFTVQHFYMKTASTAELVKERRTEKSKRHSLLPEPFPNQNLTVGRLHTCLLSL